MWLCFPLEKPSITIYIIIFLKNYFCCQITITITRIMPLRTSYVIISWTMAILEIARSLVIAVALAWFTCIRHTHAPQKLLCVHYEDAKVLKVGDSDCLVELDDGYSVKLPKISLYKLTPKPDGKPSSVGDQAEVPPEAPELDHDPAARGSADKGLDRKDPRTETVGAMCTHLPPELRGQP